MNYTLRKANLFAVQPDSGLVLKMCIADQIWATFRLFLQIVVKQTWQNRQRLRSTK